MKPLTEFAGTLTMKNVYEVLRQKEMELTRLEKEVEALRLVAPLLSEEKESLSEVSKPALATAVNGPQPTSRIAVPAPPPIPAPQPVRAAGWEVDVYERIGEDLAGRGAGLGTGGSRQALIPARFLLPCDTAVDS